MTKRSRQAPSAEDTAETFSGEQPTGTEDQAATTPGEQPTGAAQEPAERPISARAYVEETHGLVREARDILNRLYGTARKTRAEWSELAQSLGGTRK